MRILLFLLLLTGFALPTWAAEPPAVTTSEGRVSFNRAGISLPARLATLAVAETKEFSHPGEGVDSYALYRSADEKVVASVYVYYPGISHAGLAALATDAAIKINSESPVTALGSRIVAAAGHPAAAVRSDYRGYLGNLASSAAFVKAGRWTIKVRVSGPEPRRAEVEAGMSAILDMVRVEPSLAVRPGSIIETPDCPSNRIADARIRPDVGAEIMEDVIAFGTLDPTGDIGANRRDGKARPSRIGDRWCRQMLASGRNRITLLRSADTEAGAAAEYAKSLLLILYSDAGGVLEVVRSRGRYVLLNHAIGETNLLASFDSLPSDGQLVQVLTGNPELARQRAQVKLLPNGDTNIQIERSTADGPPPPTT